MEVSDNLITNQNSITKLCVISTKNPNKILLETITNVNKYYSDFDIVIIDSDSDNFETFKQIPSYVKVEYIKNKNWELGAWYYAFNKYNTYDIYMFIQDSFTPIKLMKLDYDNIINSDYFYSVEGNTTLQNWGYPNNLKNIYNNTKLQFISDMDGNSQITAAYHSSFITNLNITKKILELEEIYIDKKIKKTKSDCFFSERTIGILASKYSQNRVQMFDYFLKRNLHRD